MTMTREEKLAYRKTNLYPFETVKHAKRIVELLNAMTVPVKRHGHQVFMPGTGALIHVGQTYMQAVRHRAEGGKKEMPRRDYHPLDALPIDPVIEDFLILLGEDA